MPNDLVQVLPRSLEQAIRNNLSLGEVVEVKLKGRYKEALICTDRRVLIVKSGFMTGNTFGSNVFQVPYSNVTGCEVKTGFINNYFEISTGGMQNTPKKTFTSNGQETAREAPNTVSLLQSQMIARFRQASSFILERVHAAHRPTAALAAASQEETASGLERLWKLKCDGALTQEEFDLAKRKLIGVVVA